MRRPREIGGVVVAVCVALGCGSEVGRIGQLDVERDPTTRSGSIVIPHEAREIEYWKSELSESARYAVETPFPAEALVTEIVGTAVDQGWRPVGVGSGNGGSGTLGWGSYVDKTVEPPVTVRTWAQNWERGDGCVLRYALMYRGKESRSLRVTVHLETPEEIELLERFEKKMDRKLLP